MRDRRGGNARVLVVSGDTLPLEGLSTTGAGLCARGSVKGLRGCGHDVMYAMPEDVVAKHRVTGATAVRLFGPLTLDDAAAFLYT